MRTQPRATRVAFRRAVAASVALHVGAAVSLLALLLLRTGEAKPRAPAIDTRAPHVQMNLTEVAPEVEIRPEPPPTPAPAIATTTRATPKSPEAPPRTDPEPLARGPFVPTPPRTLPGELVALLRKPGTTAAPSHDPNVRPAGAATPSAGAGRALHGALTPAQTVVYAIDCSGSMGAAGKFDAARAALAATLAQQPATVNFQVVVYDGTARPLLTTGTLPATGENVRAVTAKLAAVEPRGKSNHLIALRAALDFKPDVVVWLTDADELTAAAIRPVLKSAARPVAVFVGLVTADGVQQPRELK